MIVIDAVLTIISPRPPGSVHGGQTFDLERMPRIGECCAPRSGASTRRPEAARKWGCMRTQTRALGSGELLFTGIMTLLVPA
jgi:hypothetical protein